MTEAGIALFITSLGILAVFVGLFIWGLASGQFRNVEDSKYILFEPEDLDAENEGEDHNA